MMWSVKMSFKGHSVYSQVKGDLEKVGEKREIKMMKILHT